VSGHAGQEHLPTLEIDEEQHIEPAQRDRVDMKEATSQCTSSLCSQEL
jgi:hypothetical protein